MCYDIHTSTEYKVSDLIPDGVELCACVSDALGDDVELLQCMFDVIDDGVEV